MPKGKLVDERVVNMVRILLSDDKELTGKELQKEVEAHLPEFKYTVRTYQDIKKKALTDLDETNKVIHDEQWSMNSYAQKGFESLYKITAQDNEAILRVRKMQSKRDDISKSMSIRQALWITRMWAIVDELHKDKTADERAYWLWVYSFEYAIREKVSRLRVGNIFFSREMDDALAKGHDEFMKYIERDKLNNWKDYEWFYNKHFLNGVENKSKDGE